MPTVSSINASIKAKKLANQPKLTPAESNILFRRTLMKKEIGKFIDNPNRKYFLTITFSDKYEALQIYGLLKKFTIELNWEIHGSLHKYDQSNGKRTSYIEGIIIDELQKNGNPHFHFILLNTHNALPDYWEMLKHLKQVFKKINIDSKGRYIQKINHKGCDLELCTGSDKLINMNDTVLSPLGDYLSKNLDDYRIHWDEKFDRIYILGTDGFEDTVTAQIRARR